MYIPPAKKRLPKVAQNFPKVVSGLRHRKAFLQTIEKASSPHLHIFKV